ncbi:hypothetical protein CDD81_6366 [Ophiocordyceps australis]|uniref:YDG domain-containing protein n=1 Tax=Ophiocordyceps australis TaxID=1399860 RepID=A0A2C5Y0L5_9HYPO|nr:hypothetical protein CDD81_6366 [Ophiocordyceps australis]
MDYSPFRIFRRGSSEPPRSQPVEMKPTPNPIDKQIYREKTTSVDSESSDDQRCPDLLLNITSPELIKYDNESKSVILEENNLLHFCDLARMGIATPAGPDIMSARTMEFLRAVAKDEACGVSTMKLSTIAFTRLDKLLKELSTAERLQRLWRERFRERYFDIEAMRYYLLPRSGLLHDVTFDTSARGFHKLWLAPLRQALSETEENLGFEPGDWWLNMACAQRDGIANSTSERPVKGIYSDILTLPLLTGREEVQSLGGMVKYIREGPQSDMHISLLSKVGTQVRVLRGHHLKSWIAPKAGVRYDGLYYIRQWGVKGCEASPNQVRLVVTLEREAHQRSMDEVVVIPYPSQLDEWQIFERYEGETIRHHRGERAFLDWKAFKADEQMYMNEWRGAMEMGNEMHSGQENLARWAAAMPTDATSDSRPRAPRSPKSPRAEAREQHSVLAQVVEEEAEDAET